MFALSFHEFAHAWMAEKCGDSTAARMGRLTLNPMAHLDMMGSLMILFVGFGWAKPVPVDGRNLRNPRTDMMKVAAAGPIANLLLALVGGLFIRSFFSKANVFAALSGLDVPNQQLIILFWFFRSRQTTHPIIGTISVAAQYCSQKKVKFPNLILTILSDHKKSNIQRNPNTEKTIVVISEIFFLSTFSFFRK